MLCCAACLNTTLGLFDLGLLSLHFFGGFIGIVRSFVRSYKLNTCSKAVKPNWDRILRGQPGVFAYAYENGRLDILYMTEGHTVAFFA